MTYRLLPESEHWKFVDLMNKIGRASAIPVDGSYRVAVAETELGEIAGFQVLQMALHAEPLWTDPAAQGKVSLASLLKTIESTIPGVLYYLFSMDAHQESYPKRFGFTQIPWKLWSKRVTIPQEEVA